MIRVTAELLPKGDESAAKSLGSVEIANVGGTKASGDYAVRILKAGNRKALWKLGQVRGFPRLRLGVWDLLLRALADILNASTGGARRSIAVPSDWQKPISDAAIEDAEMRALSDEKHAEAIGAAFRAWHGVAPAYRRALIESLRARDESGTAAIAADLLAAIEAT